MCGKRLASIIWSIVFRAGDHFSGPPIGVLLQSNARISAPISPPPGRNEKSGRPDFETILLVRGERAFLTRVCKAALLCLEWLSVCCSANIPRERCVFIQATVRL